MRRIIDQGVIVEVEFNAVKDSAYSLLRLELPPRSVSVDRVFGADRCYYCCCCLLFSGFLVLFLCRCCCCDSVAVVSAVPAAVCAVFWCWVAAVVSAVKTTAVWPFAGAGSVFVGAACGV